MRELRRPCPHGTCGKLEKHRSRLLARSWPCFLAKGSILPSPTPTLPWEEVLDHLRDLVAVTQPQISAQTQRLHTGSHTGQQTPPVSLVSGSQAGPATRSQPLVLGGLSCTLGTAKGRLDVGFSQVSLSWASILSSTPIPSPPVHPDSPSRPSYCPQNEAQSARIFPQDPPEKS